MLTMEKEAGKVRTNFVLLNTIQNYLCLLSYRLSVIDTGLWGEQSSMGSCKSFSTTQPSTPIMSSGSLSWWTLRMAPLSVWSSTNTQTGPRTMHQPLGLASLISLDKCRNGRWLLETDLWSYTAGELSMWCVAIEVCHHALMVVALQWWVWSYWDLHSSEHSDWEAQDWGSGGCVPHSQKPEAAKAWDGPNWGTYSGLCVHQQWYIFIPFQAQFEFCYKTVLEYLESFELYDNFK